MGRRVHLFGLTGGIASGKSTVAARLRVHGVPVIDADALAREVVEPGTEALRAIAAAFGDGVLTPEGRLDRKAVAAIVFADPARRAQLNAIVHPAISRATMARSAELAGQGERMACYEAALLVENGIADAFRPLIVVACPEADQIARLMARDGATREEAVARIAAQKPLADKVRVADFVIDTTGAVEDTRRRTDAVLASVCDRLGLDPAGYAVR